MNDDEFAGKSLVELFDMLEPVPEPPSISLVPETEGWIWLGLALLAVAIWVFWKWQKMHRANEYRRAALAELHAAGDDPAAIAGILRRTALAAFPRGDVAALSGDDWLAFLDQHAPQKGFLSDTGRAMVRAPYLAEITPVKGLKALASDWVRSHSVKAKS